MGHLKDNVYRIIHGQDDNFEYFLRIHRGSQNLDTTAEVTKEEDDDLRAAAKVAYQLFSDTLKAAAPKFFAQLSDERVRKFWKLYQLE